MLQFNNLRSSLFSIHFEMRQYGWAALHFNCDGVNVLVDLSDVFNPFQDLVIWGWRIQQNILPALINIDEEGHITTIIAKEFHENTLSIQFKGKNSNHTFKVDKMDFCHALKQEIKRFFNEEFNKNEWEEMNPERNQPYCCIKDWVLNHNWIK